MNTNNKKWKVEQSTHTHTHTHTHAHAHAHTHRKVEDEHINNERLNNKHKQRKVDQ